MTRRNETRSDAYRERFASNADAASNPRRVKRIPVPENLAANVRGGRTRDDEDVKWLAVFEDELAYALADFAGCREQGLETSELADYIAYLNECVACLVADTGRGRLGALESVSRLARKTERR